MRRHGVCTDPNHCNTGFKQGLNTISNAASLCSTTRSYRDCVDKQINIDALPKNLILQLVKLIRTLKHSAGAKTLIVGDNDVSPILGWLASRFANDTKIQISLHASLDHILFPTGIFNIIRKHLFFWSLKHVNSIRMVSSIDVERMAKLLPIPAPEIVVAPTLS